MLSHRFWSLLAIGSLIAGLAASCSTSQDESAPLHGGTFGTGGRCCDSSTGGGAGLDIGVPDRGHDAGELINPLCLSCDPDETLDVCAGFDAGVADAASDSDAKSSDGARPFGSEYGPDAPNVPAPPGSSEAGLRPDAGSDGAPPPQWGCRIQGRDSSRRAVCAKAGSGSNGACVSSADCAVGHACTGDTGVAQCRALCCNGSETCETGRYCAERPLREETEETGNGLMVPACVLADDCDLAEPYPCRSASCKCPVDTACTVVRADGTTSCVKPGTGLVGDPCPCAWGHICSQGTGKCMKLCTPAAGQAECGSGRCQGGTENLPEGWGVCVGAKPGDGGL